jgi:membrane-bound serine protease (ClpP class)
VGLVWALPGAAGAQAPADRAHVDVIEVSGFVDGIVADFIVDALATAAAEGATALVIQLDSGRSILADAEMEELLREIDRAPVPVGVWIGPSGAQAAEGAAPLVAAADISGISPGSHITAEVSTSTVSTGPASTTERLSAAEAVRGGLVDLDSETLGDFIVDLDAKEVDGTVLETAEVVDTADGPRLRPTVTVRFAKLGAVPRLLHTAASPAVAYLLLLIGLSLLIFELFTGGVGVAGLTGALALIVAASGLATLPTDPLGLSLVVVAVAALAVDVQTGVPRFWTAIGTVTLVAGSLLLFTDGVSVGWLPLVVGVGGTLLLLVSATPAVVRSRFSTPTIGRDWMVGELVTTESVVDPDGTVLLRDARWRARTNRATPIAAGAPARVTGIDGVVLEVEPLEGAARDYRERGTPR